MGPLNAIRVSSVRYYYYTGPYGECNEFSVHFARPRVHMYACKSIEYETLSLSTPSSSQYRIFLTLQNVRWLSGGKPPGDGRVGIPDAKNSDGVRTFAEPDIRGCIR